MRVISKHGRTRTLCRPGQHEAYANGVVRTIERELVAEFEPWLLSPHEREMAIAEWTFNGSYQEQDEVTTVPPDYRIGLFDSEQAQARHGWSDDERILVERKLEVEAERDPSYLVVRSTLRPPWPRYDEFRGTPGALIRRIVEDGFDLDEVLVYEREHQNRPKIVEELGKAIETGTVEVEPDEETILG